MSLVKSNILSMPLYSVPQQFAGIKLNQNESPLDLPLELKEQILQRLVEAQWNRYPENSPAAMIPPLSAYTGSPAEGIMIGSSSNELIQTVIYGCCDSKDRVLTVSPTFSVYRQIASVMNIDVLQVPLEKDFSFNTAAIIKNLKETRGIKAVILASPNNPTGTVLGLEDIEAIARQTPALVVMDEAYFEFSGSSAQSLVKKYENIIIIRTFSKALRAAGLRLGYLLGQPQVVNEFKKVKLPFSVGVFQQIAGTLLLENREWLKNHIETIIYQRERVWAQLQTFPGLEPIPSKANFILFRSTRKPARQLYEQLYHQGVLVRVFNSPDLDNLLRVSIGTETENDLFLEKLKKILTPELP